jgi:type II secretory pathway pseudopilin PulG
MMRANRTAGITLIEILIAVSLLSLLSAGILIAMHLGLNTMERTDARMVRNRRAVNARKIIESEIDGFVASTASFRLTPETFQVVSFFQAEPESMRFVSAFSLQDAWRGRPQITALQVIPGARNEGVRLIVNETPYTGPVQAGQSIVSFGPDPATGRVITHYAPIAAGPGSFVLADRLRFCRFSYLERRTLPPFEIWQPDWFTSERLPAGIRIEMAPIDSTAADLHVTTVTVPLHVNRTSGTVYADQL